MSKNNKKKSSPPLSQGRRSVLLALFILLLISLWMLSGTLVIGGSDTDKVPPIAAANNGQKTRKAPQKKLFAVRARLFTSRLRHEVLHIRARSEAETRVEIRAETAGRVVHVNGRKGQLVKKGDILCKLDEGSRQATLLQAKALVAQAKSDLFAASKLAKRGYSARLDVNAKQAAYDGAMASLKRARIDLDHTTIKAPFTGIIEEQSAKVGDYLTTLARNKSCARLVKLNPLLIVGDVSERNIKKLYVGQKGRAELVTGEKVKGFIRYISPSAKVETRTFRIELQVNNPHNRMRNGVTADIYIPLKATSGHLISPALLTLNDQGDVGVRSVGPDSVVRFLPVKIIEQTAKGIWVSGLPKRLIIITVGQDYVTEGQKVKLVLEQKPRTKEPTKAGSAS